MRTILNLLLCITFLVTAKYSNAQSVPRSGNESRTMCSGTITDMGGSGAMSPDADGSLTIYPSTPGNKVVLKLTMLDLGFYNDYLYIYNGTDTNSTLIDVVENTNYLERKRAFYGDNSQGALTIRLVTGFYADDDGFEFNVFCVDPATATTMVHNEKKTIQACSGYLYDHGGPLGDYSLEGEEEIMILPDGDDKRVQITFEYIHFDRENRDQINFLGGAYGDYPNTNITSYTIASFHENEKSYVASRPDGSIWLRTRESGSESGQGFRARLSCIDTPTENPVVVPKTGSESITTCDETIYDNGRASGVYMPNADGTLTINPANEGEVVTLNFDELSIETNDVLEIYDGVDNTTSLLESVTGSTLPSEIKATNESGALTLQFLSDGSIENDGYTINIGCDAPATTSAVVPYSGTTSITTCDTVIKDHNEDGNYSNNADGSLTIMPAESGKVVQLTFSEFNTETGYDYLNVYNGTQTSDELIGELSGNNLPEPIVASNVDGALALRFTSDGTFVDPGFAVQVSCITQSNVPYIGTSTLTTCDAIIKDHNDDGDYSDNSDGTLTIMPAENGNMIQVVFSEFNLEADYDFLSVYNGTSDTATLLSTLTGDVQPEPITADNTDGALTLKFTSDGSFTLSGFSAQAFCSSVTGLSVFDRDSHAGLLYPNPGNGTFSISSSGAIASVQIYNSTGRLVYASDHSISSNKAIATGLPSGIYQVEVIGKDGTHMTDKLVIGQ